MNNRASSPRRSAVSSTKDARPDRDGKQLLATHVDTSILRACKILAAKQGTTVAVLLHEAVAHELTQHGESLPPKLRAYLKAHGRPVRPTVAPADVRISPRKALQLFTGKLASNVPT